MSLPRLALRAYHRRHALRALSQAIEPLEARRLMCTLEGDDLEQALVEDHLRHLHAADDHDAAWYEPVGRPVTGRSASGDVVPAGVSFNVNAAGLPLLTSRADGQGMKVFLDFDGYGTDTPFSTDADGSTFNSSEQVNIYDTWRDIVSYFAPFNLNITTIQPPIGGSNPAFVWHRISNSIQGGAAYVGYVTNDSSNSWTGQDGGTTRHSGVAHEIGHQLGLSHQSEYDAAGNKIDEYSDGYSNRDRPIMGVDYAENVRTWMYGRNSDGAMIIEDDMAWIANSIAGRVGGDGYRPDDFAGTLASASLMPTTGLQSGIIERFDDADVFKFTSSGGTYELGATPTFESSTAPKLELLDSNGTLIASRDDADRRATNNNAEEFSLNLDAGTYYVRVSSSGDYAEQGEYLVTAAPLPAGWTSQDVGAATIYRAGTAAYDPTSNTLTQLGGGNDIWSTSDQFRFTSTALTGDGSITARIDALDNVDVNAKAGVMIRATNVTNSAHVYVGIKPSGQLDPIVRTGSGGTAFTLGNPAGVTAPWVRLTRTGNVFTIERSADGVNWSTYGTTSVTMGSSVLIGFATNSRSPRQAAYAKFSGISFSGALGTAAPTYNALPAPAGLTAAPATGANTSISLAWSAVAGATGYAIDRSVDGVTFTALTTVAAGVLSYLDPNPFGSMRYYYRVAALDAASTRSTPSAAANVVNKPGATTDPNSSYAKPVIRFSSTQLLLNWTDVQGETGYRVERSTNGGAFGIIGTTARNATAFNDSNLTSFTSYTYRVTPLTAVGDGVTLAWTTSAVTPLVAVTNFHITTQNATSLLLVWNDIANETTYRLERSTDGGTWTSLGDRPVNSTTYTDTTASPLTHYYYRLRAIDSTGGLGDTATTFGATKPTVALADPWSDADVGAVPGPGAAAGTNGGTWTVLGSGADIWGTADQFHFASRAVNGDGSIVARLTGLEDTDYYVKAGVMFRESNAANSPYVFMHYSNGPGLQLEFRDSAGASSGNAFVAASSARWLKLTRVGNVFTGSYSSDGVNWTVAATRTIAMTAVAKMGLAATSHNTTRMTAATFDNVTTTGVGVSTAPTITTAAAAAPATVTGNTTNLTVSATDDGGAANLSYLWSIVSKPTGVANPTFNQNGTNAANAVIATFAAAGSYVLRVTVSDAQGQTATSDVAVTVTLRASSSLYVYDAARPEFRIQLNGNVSATLDPADLVLTNITTGAVIPTSAITASFSSALNIATFQFTAGPNNTLPDGNYTAKLLGGSVSEPSGVALTADTTFNFFVKAGDVNHDGAVNFNDLVILAQNYGQTGKTYGAGNIDYDPAGNVDFNDLVILAQQYNTSLPSIGAISLPTAVKPTKATRAGGAAIV